MSGVPTLLSSSGMRHVWAHKRNAHVLSKATAQQDADLLTRIAAFRQQSAVMNELQSDTRTARLHLAEAYLQLGKAGGAFKEVMSSGVAPNSNLLESDAHVGQQQVESLLVATAQMQRSFHDTFGQGWQEQLLQAIDAEIAASLDVQLILEQYEQAVREDAYYSAKLEQLQSRGNALSGSEVFERNESKRRTASCNLEELVGKLTSALAARRAARACLLQEQRSSFEVALGELTANLKAAIVGHSLGSREKPLEPILDIQNIYGELDDTMVDHVCRGLLDFKSRTEKQIKSSTANIKFAVVHKRMKTGREHSEDICTNALANHYDVENNLRNLCDILEQFNKHWLSGWQGVAAIANGFLALEARQHAFTPGPSVITESSIACIKDSASSWSQSFSDDVLQTLHRILDDFACLPEVASQCEEAARNHNHYEEKLTELILDKDSAVSLAKHNERITRNQEKKIRARQASKASTELWMEALQRYDDMRLQTSLQAIKAVVDIQFAYYSDIIIGLGC